MLAPNSLEPSRVRDVAGVSQAPEQAGSTSVSLVPQAAPERSAGPASVGVSAVATALESQQTGGEHHFPLSDPSRPGTPPRSAGAAGAKHREDAHLLLCFLRPRRPPTPHPTPPAPPARRAEPRTPRHRAPLRPCRRRQLTPRSFSSRRPPGPAPTCHGGGHGATPRSSVVSRPARRPR